MTSSTAAAPCWKALVALCRKVAKSDVPLAVERAVVLVLLRLAADDQDGLALDVEAGVVVVVELLRVVLGRDPVAGEDDRHAIKRPAASRWPAGVKSAFGAALSAFPSGPLEAQLGAVPQDRGAADRERLEVSLGARGGLEARRP